MEPTPQTEIIQPNGKIYTESAFLIGLIIGGPLAAVYMYIANRKTMGLKVNPPKIWSLSIVGVLFLMALGDFIPLEGIQIGIAVGLVISIRGLINTTQGPVLQNYIRDGGKAFPIGRSIVIGLISALATLVLAAPFVLL
jgi:hypothetical protein